RPAGLWRFSSDARRDVAEDLRPSGRPVVHHVDGAPRWPAFDGGDGGVGHVRDVDERDVTRAVTREPKPPGASTLEPALVETGAGAIEEGAAEDDPVEAGRPDALFHAEGGLGRGGRGTVSLLPSDV